MAPIFVVSSYLSSCQLLSLLLSVLQTSLLQPSLHTKKYQNYIRSHNHFCALSSLLPV